MSDKKIELLEQQNKMLRNALCKCPPDGRFINCPIHGWNTNFEIIERIEERR